MLLPQRMAENVPWRNYDIKGFLLPFYYYFVVFSNCFYSYYQHNLLTKSSDIQNKNTWGVKKGQGQEEPATKSSDIN